MLRQAARTALSLILMGSLALAGWSLWQVRQNPALRPLVDRGAAQIVAATDRWLATHATAPAVEARLDGLLADDKRNWLAIKAVEGVAANQRLTLSVGYGGRRAKAWASDSGWLTRSGDCLSCAVNAANCDLSGILICQAPMVLTPLGDLAGVGIESFHWVVGSDVDQLNLAFSAVGLGAEAALALTGGSSALVKGGASIGKLALKMKLLSPRLTGLLLEAARRGIDWQRLPWFPGPDDLRAAIQPEVIRPVVAVASDIGRIGGKLSVPETLHLLRYVDDAAEARALANAAEALGPKTVGRLELMGKSRFLRATLRASDSLLALGWGFLGLIWALPSLVAGAVQHAVMHGAKRGLRQTKKRR